MEATFFFAQVEQRITTPAQIVRSTFFHGLLKFSRKKFLHSRQKMTGGAPEVRSDKSLTLLTFGI